MMYTLVASEAVESSCPHHVVSGIGGGTSESVATLMAV